VNHDVLAAALEVVADAIHEAFLGARAFDLRLRQNDHRLAAGDLRGHLPAFLNARLHAPNGRGAQQDDESAT
jgi:hypothetical protein